jgi:hypothetical protein
MWLFLCNFELVKGILSHRVVGGRCEGHIIRVSWTEGPDRTVQLCTNPAKVCVMTQLKLHEMLLYSVFIPFIIIFILGLSCQLIHLKPCPNRKHCIGMCKYHIYKIE